MFVATILEFKKPTVLKDENGAIHQFELIENGLFYGKSVGMVHPEFAITYLREHVKYFETYPNLVKNVLVDLSDANYNVYKILDFLKKEYDPALGKTDAKKYAMVTGDSYIAREALNFIQALINARLKNRMFGDPESAIKWLYH